MIAKIVISDHQSKYLSLIFLKLYQLTALSYLIRQKCISCIEKKTIFASETKNIGK